MPNYENLIDLSLLSTFKGQNDLAYAAKSDVATLVGSDSGKSVRTIANEELAAQLIPATAQEALNSLTEIAAWIQAHPGDAAAMNAAIAALQAKVDTGDLTVSGYVADYVSLAIGALNIGDYAKAADLTALAARLEAAEGKITGLESSVNGLGALAAKDTVSESDLDAALAEKVNAASEGNHAHANKDALDGITAEKVAAWDAKADVSDIPTISLATEAAVLALFQ